MLVEKSFNAISAKNDCLSKNKKIQHELWYRKERTADDDTEGNSVQSTQAQTGGGQSSFTQERAEKDQCDTVQSIET